MSTAVLGIGNTLMGDDGVGHRVLELLGHRDLPVRLITRPNADMGTLEVFRTSSRVFVIDAVDVGADPGDVFRFTPDDVGMASLRSNSIHGMSVGHVVSGARLLGADPEVVIYGVQVRDILVDPDNLSPAVSDAARKVARAVEDEIRSSLPESEGSALKEVGTT